MKFFTCSFVTSEPMDKVNSFQSIHTRIYYSSKNCTSCIYPRQIRVNGVGYLSDISDRDTAAARVK